MRDAPSPSGEQDAELTAINALQFLAGRAEELGRFLALSGVDPAQVRRLAEDNAFLGGVLDFLLADEALLLAFTAEAGLGPDSVAIARRRLDPGRPPLESGEA